MHVSDLAEALALRPTGDGHRLAFADPRYQSTNETFGGWTAAVALRGAMQSGDEAATPSAITINFVRLVESGTEVLVRVHLVGGGRSIQHWRAEVVSAEDEGLLAYAMIVLSERRTSDGVTQPVMPDVPQPESLEEIHPPGTQGKRASVRPVFGYPPFGRDSTRSSSWVRDMTGRPVDHLQLAFLADAYAPRAFHWSDGPRPSATITYSVYFHGTREEIAAVGDDYLLNEATGTRGADSTSGQQARLWSRKGDLLATSEQLHWFR